MYEIFENEKSIKYRKNLAALQEKGIEKFLNGYPLFSCINRVAIMISNVCNYSCEHKACPAHFAKTKCIMPSSVVFMIINELSMKDFEGEVCFHLYNEPLIDPRLFEFVRYARNKMPSVNIHIYTNGFYLNEVILNELEEAGVTRITVTAYGEKEWKRITNLDVNVAFYVLFGNLDARLEMYSDREISVCNERCISFFEQIPIYVDGEVGMCCLDWKHEYQLGNVNYNTLEDILNCDKVRDIQYELLQGNRTGYGICRNCSWKNYMGDYLK